MWKNDLKISDTREQDLCDIRNVLIVTAGILNLNVSIIKKSGPFSLAHTMDERDARASVRPTLSL